MTRKLKMKMSSTGEAMEPGRKLRVSGGVDNNVAPTR